ncbi:hypothetical protein [Actinoallomurus sp. CA-142502]|uniref:hypothetical protein n=1 Tax=Actinoallomurus sp. CA-142502 TaxID=3239885 RepID=UPI003D94D126
MATMPLAVIGLAARFGGFGDLDAVEAALYDGRRRPAEPSENTAAAAETAEPEPATALARAALTDCRAPAGGPIAVLAGAADPGAADGIAALVSARLRLTGPTRGRALSVLRTGWPDDAAEPLRSGTAAQVLLVATDRRGGGVAFVLAPATAGATGYAVLEEVVTAPFPATRSPLGSSHVELDCPPSALDRAAAVLDALIPAPAPALGAVPGRAVEQALGWAEAVVRAVLALRGNFIPGTRADDPVRATARQAGIERRFPVAPRPWLRGGREPRRSAVLAVEPARLLVFTDTAVPQPRRTALVPTTPVTLVAVRAADPSDLAARLDALDDDPGAALSRARTGHVEGPPAGALHLGVVAADAAQLRAEVEACRRALGEGRLELSTPRGSALTGRPLGGAGSVAFMYPGAFSAYPGAARNAFRLFEPTLHGMAAMTSDPAGIFAVDRLYPCFSGRPTAREIVATERALAAEPSALMAASMSYAVLFTRALREVFGVRPAVAFGYSLGESSMLRALGVWAAPDADARMAELRDSPLFRTRLSGPLDAVREYWARLPEPPARPGWEVLVLLAAPDEVRAAITAPDRTWISIINGPREVVVCGDPGGCAKLVARLGCEHVRLPYQQVLHAPPAESELAAFVTLNRNVTTAVDRPVFLSAAVAGPLELEAESVAHRLAEMSVRHLDFRALVERAHAAGARVFVEVGPAGMLTRLVEATLAGQDHVAIPLDRRGVDAQSSLVRALSRLHAHHVPLDLSGWGSGHATDTRGG